MKYFDRRIQRELPDRKDKPECIVIWGDPGTGKTTAARQIAYDRGLTDDDIYIPDAGNGSGSQWFDNYEQHKCILFNDVNLKLVVLERFKIYIDHGKQMVQVKNNFVKLNSPLFIFTSNYNPAHWWGMKSGSIEQKAVLRRIDMVYEYAYAEQDKLNSDNIDTAWSRAIITTIKGKYLIGK